MLLCEVLEFVIVEVATEPNGGQHGDVPVVESFATRVATRVRVDILGDKIQNLISKLRLAVDVLQASQDRDDFISAIQIELHFGNRLTVQPRLIREAATHPFAP